MQHPLKIVLTGLAGVVCACVPPQPVPQPEPEPVEQEQDVEVEEEPNIIFVPADPNVPLPESEGTEREDENLPPNG